MSKSFSLLPHKETQQFSGLGVIWLHLDLKDIINFLTVSSHYFN